MIINEVVGSDTHRFNFNVAQLNQHKAQRLSKIHITTSHNELMYLLQQIQHPHLHGMTQIFHNTGGRVWKRRYLSSTFCISPQVAKFMHTLFLAVMWFWLYFVCHTKIVAQNWSCEYFNIVEMWQRWRQSNFGVFIFILANHRDYAWFGTMIVFKKKNYSGYFDAIGF